MSDSAESPTEAGSVKKDRIDALLSLADSCWKQMDARRAYEWKASFGLWTALGLLAGLLIRGEFKPPMMIVITCATLLFAIVAVYIYPWSIELHRRNAQDKRAANHFWGLAVAELGINPVDNFAVTPIRSVLKDWSHVTQILLTLMLAAIVAIALVRGNRMQSPSDRSLSDAGQCQCTKSCLIPGFQQKDYPNPQPKPK